MEYRLIAFDLDNTLLNAAREVGEIDRLACIDVMDRGGRVILCSGRGRTGMLPVANALGILERGEYFISDNGGAIFRGAETTPIYENRITEEDAKWIFALGRAHLDILNIQAYTADEVFVERYDFTTEYYSKAVKTEVKTVAALEELIPLGIVKIVFNSWKPDEVDALKERIRDELPATLNCFKSTRQLLEFVPEETSKGNAVRFVAEQYGIPMSEVICMGDNENDEPMLAVAGLAAAPCNAIEHTKAIAGYVTENDHDHGAAAEVLAKFMHD